MKTYVCPGCGHEQQAETPPLCEKCRADWSHAKSRMVEKVEESDEPSGLDRPSQIFKHLKR